MKTTMARKMAMTGAGMGVALFAVYGLLPGAFLGGLMGINMAGAINGMPVEPGTLSRIIIALGMLAGVGAVGTAFTTGGAACGWAAGRIADAVSAWHERKERTTAARA